MTPKWFRKGIGGKPDVAITTSPEPRWPHVDDVIHAGRQMTPEVAAQTVKNYNEMLAHLQPMSQPVMRPTMKHKFTIQVRDITTDEVLHQANFSAATAKELGQYVRRVADQVKMLDFNTEATSSAKAAD